MKLLLLFITLGLLFFGVFLNRNKHSLPVIPTLTAPETIPTPTPLSVPNGEIIEVVFNSTDYQILVIPIKTENKILLIPNFTNGKNAEGLVTENNCRSAINGGFYRDDGKPLGFFYSQGKSWSTQIQSQLVTGFFWQDLDGKRGFGKELPVTTGEADFILQAGPVVKIADYTLKLIQDEPARRSVVGKDKNNNLFLISIVEKGNLFSGPFLSQLPAIFFQPGVQLRWAFTEILNLDGGSASFFYDKGKETELILPSLTQVGSLICLK